MLFAELGRLVPRRLLQIDTKRRVRIDANRAKTVLGGAKRRQTTLDMLPERR